jgi:hypothetical protein
MFCFSNNPVAGHIEGMGSEQAEWREIWRQRIEQQQKSGGSIRAYCEDIGIPEHAFYGRRQRLRTETLLTSQ